MTKVAQTSPKKSHLKSYGRFFVVSNSCQNQGMNIKNDGLWKLSVGGAPVPEGLGARADRSQIPRGQGRTAGRRAGRPGRSRCQNQVRPSRTQSRSVAPSPSQSNQSNQS